MSIKTFSRPLTKSCSVNLDNPSRIKVSSVILVGTSPDRKDKKVRYVSGYSDRFLLGNRRFVNQNAGLCLSMFMPLLAAAERREMYEFSVDLGKLGLQIAETFGTSEEKW